MAYTLYLKGGNTVTVDAKFIHSTKEIFVFHNDENCKSGKPAKEHYVAYFQVFEIQGLVYPNPNEAAIDSAFDIL